MKSHILWLSYGDANTKFFHVQTKMKKARQHIIALKNEANVWVQGTTLHTLILNTLKSIFQFSSSSQPSPPHSFYSSLDFNTQNFLNTLLDFPSIDETRATLWNMHPLKSPGHAQFFQSNWNSLGTDVAKFIQTIFITTPIPEDLTQVKLVLIPKISNPKTASHLQPRSLCNTMYKLLTKLLVNRLKPFLPAMNHPSESGFVHGR